MGTATSSGGTVLKEPNVNQCLKARRKRRSALIFLQIKTIICDSLNSSIIKACTSLSLLVFLVAIDFASNSPQEAGAGHSDLVLPTLVTTNIHLIHSRRPYRLVIALHPSSLTPQSPELFWLIPMPTPFTRGQPPPPMSRQPLSPIKFLSELRSKNIGLSLPAVPRPPLRGSYNPSRPSHCPLHIHKFTQLYLFEPPPLGSAEKLAGRVPHLVFAYFLAKILR